MKKQILTIAAALAFTAVVPATSHAQQATQAKVSFAFQAGDTIMPAGEYQIRRGLPSTKTVQQIRRTDSSASTFVITIAADSKGNNGQPELIFHCYTNECFLSEIWDGSGRGRELLRSRRERELAHAKTENELVVVVLPVTVTP